MVEWHIYWVAEEEPMEGKKCPMNFDSASLVDYPSIHHQLLERLDWV